MKFDYYVNDGIDRLFRYASETGQQDRWDNTPGVWSNVAPSLVDKIYSGKVGLDEVTAEEARRGYPKAFGDHPFSGAATIQDKIAQEVLSDKSAHNNRSKPDKSRAYAERVILTSDMMDRVQVYISRKLPVENYIHDYQTAEADRPAVRKFYADLETEMAQRVLEPGQVWDVPGEWS